MQADQEHLRLYHKKHCLRWHKLGSDRGYKILALEGVLLRNSEEEVGRKVRQVNESEHGDTSLQCDETVSQLCMYTSRRCTTSSVGLCVIVLVTSVRDFKRSQSVLLVM